MTDSEEKISTIYDRLDEELYRALDGEIENAEIIEPTEEEKRNGWTTETLTEYIAERKAEESLSIDPTSTQRRLEDRPDMANSKYSPHKWRK